MRSLTAVPVISPIWENSTKSERANIPFSVNGIAEASTVGKTATRPVNRAANLILDIQRMEMSKVGQRRYWAVVWKGEGVLYKDQEQRFMFALICPMVRQTAENYRLLSLGTFSICGSLASPGGISAYLSFHVHELRALWGRLGSAKSLKARSRRWSNGKRGIPYFEDTILRAENPRTSPCA